MNMPETRGLSSNKLGLRKKRPLKNSCRSRALAQIRELWQPENSCTHMKRRIPTTLHDDVTPGEPCGRKNNHQTNVKDDPR